MMLWREVLRESTRRTRKNLSRMQRHGPSNMRRSDKRSHEQAEQGTTGKVAVGEHDLRTLLAMH